MNRSTILSFNRSRPLRAYKWRPTHTRFIAIEAEAPRLRFAGWVGQSVEYQEDDGLLNAGRGLAADIQQLVDANEAVCREFKQPLLCCELRAVVIIKQVGRASEASDYAQFSPLSMSTGTSNKGAERV
jgi:hypothetical protein